MGSVLSVSIPEQNISNIKVTSTQLQDSIMKNAPKWIYNKSEFLQILCIYKLSESKYNSNYKAILSDGELRIPAFFKSNDLNDSSIIKNLQASQYMRILSADLIFEYEQAILVISDFLYYSSRHKIWAPRQKKMTPRQKKWPPPDKKNDPPRKMVHAEFWQL